MNMTVEEFQDYINETYCGKKIVVIYGNCHTTVIAEMLNKCQEFCDEYVIYPILPIQTVKEATYFDLPIFKVCDVFIHQSIRLNNRYGEEFASENIIKKLKPGAKIVAIPNVYHLPMCFFPQYLEKQEYKYRGGTIFFRDKIIDDAYRQYKKIDDIVDLYKKEDLFSDTEIKESFDKFIAKVKDREADWDIKVSEFILKNYKDTQLFFDPNHPTNFFFSYVVKELLRLLGIEYDQEKLDFQNVLKLDSYEMPICASVRKKLELNFEQSNIRRTGRKMGRREMPLREYILQYRAFEWQDKENGSLNRVYSFMIWGVMCVRRLLEHFMGKNKKKV